MNHHRTVFLVICTCIYKVKTLWQVVVHLDCTQLPTTTNCVFHHKVEFWTIECCFTKFYFSFQTFVFASLDDSRLCFFPYIVRTNIFFFVIWVAKRDLSLKVFEIQCFEDDEDNIHHFHKLFFQLVWTTEDVSIVLCERTHTCQSVQLTTLLITIHCTKLCITQWKVFVRVWHHLIYFTVVRTVHWFQQIFFALFWCVNWLERVFTIFSIVT